MTMFCDIIMRLIARRRWVFGYYRDPLIITFISYFVIFAACVEHFCLEIFQRLVGGLFLERNICLTEFPMLEGRSALGIHDK